MIVHRLIRGTGLGVLLTLALAVTGCAGEGGGPDAGAAPGNDQVAEADAKLALASSADALAQESFKLEMTMGELMTATGAMDPAAGTGNVAMTILAEGVEMNLEVIFIGTDMWTNLGELGALLGAQAEWMHIDQGKLPEGGFMGVQPGKTDLANAAEMLQGLGEVERVDDHTYRGEIDVTKGDSSLFDEEMVAAIGEQATTLPFTATLDDQGRLTHLVIDLPPQPDFPAESMDLRYFDFGAPVEVTPPPAGEVSEMPAEFYQMFQR
jgi:hypothetical protein